MTSWKQHSGGIAWPTLAFTAALLGATVALHVAGMTGALPLPVAAVGLTVAVYAWFTPLHEAVHGNVGGSRRRAWLDAGVGWLASLMFLAPFPAFRAVHLRHHGTVNQEGRDPDLWVSGDTVARVAFRCLTIIGHYYLCLARMRRESPAMASAFRTSVAVGAAIGLAAAWLVFQGHGDWLFWLWLLPDWIASALLVLAFDWLPHRPHQDTGRFHNARILEGGPLLRLLLLGQDAHLVHHLWPRVPFYRYHAVWEADRDALLAQGVRVDRV